MLPCIALYESVCLKLLCGLKARDLWQRKGQTRFSPPA